MSSIGLEQYTSMLDQVINLLDVIQDFPNEEARAFYQMRSLAMEFKQEMNGGYISVDYVLEKCDTIVNVAKAIASKKGMYHNE